MPEEKSFSAINTPADLQQLPADELPALADEVRRKILEIVSNRGGHLASNLGVVELTIALLRVFTPPEDKIVWDTSHQSYTYKLFTERRELLETLRDNDGCCGFLNREESEYDAFGAGHAGTALSAALGMAVARDQRGEDNHVLAVVGDGALGSGPALEGLNNIVNATKDFILVLNDNKMSIAPNVGAFSQHLSTLLTNDSYNRFRRWVNQSSLRFPRLNRFLQKIDDLGKGFLLPGAIFQKLGLRYIGPIDGHDISLLERVFTGVKKMRKPVIVHVVTEKGHGYVPATAAPESYHGTGQFDPDEGLVDLPNQETSFSQEFGRILCECAAEDQSINAITAAMCKGTGLKEFQKSYPERLHDVGIAEEHALVYAAGMAASGLRPVVAIYASFSQRAMDYVFHDICLQNLPVLICLDRAGIVADGPTHHGILDVAFWRSLPNLDVLQPADSDDLDKMMRAALGEQRPVVIRYPKSAATPLPVKQRASLERGRAEILRHGDDLAIWGVGREAARALELAEKLEEQGVQAAVVNPRYLQPFDKALMQTHLEADIPLVILEDHSLAGGFSETVRATFAGHPNAKRIQARGWPAGEFIPWGTVGGIRKKFNLDFDSLLADLLSLTEK